MTGELRYEWVRISTVRSTWALIGLAMLVPAGLALFVSWLVGSLGPDAGGPPDGSGAGGLAGFLPLTAAVLCAIGAAAFGQEYRHGLIRITLATFPRRTPVFIAKTLMVAIVVVVAAVLAIAMIVLAQALGGVIAGTGAIWDETAWGASGVRAAHRARGAHRADRERHRLRPGLDVDRLAPSLLRWSGCGVDGRRGGVGSSGRLRRLVPDHRDPRVDPLRATRRLIRGPHAWPR
jgi:hypothetical protein